MTYKAINHTFAIYAYGKSKYLEECIKSVLKQKIRGNVIMATSTPNAYVKEMAQRYAIPLYIKEGKSDIATERACL